MHCFLQDSETSKKDRTKQESIRAPFNGSGKKIMVSAAALC
jgi:hypothetical protein